MDSPRTHDLDFLLSECMKLDSTGFSEINLKSLTDFGVNIRYPDDFYIPDPSEVQDYRDIALRIKSLIDSKLKF